MIKQAPDQICLSTAVESLVQMLKDMREGGALGGCDPTWAAHMAATTHEAIVCINTAIRLQEATQ